MNVERIVVDKKQARELYREYKAHAAYGDKMDKEIRRAYQLIAQGRMVIKALESIKAAGLNADGWPKLALANATIKSVECEMSRDGRVEFAKPGWGSSRDKKNTFRWPAGAFTRQTPMKEWRETARAMVPMIPLKLRPTEALANYHILWEAEWRPVPPVDPMLLRRIGAGRARRVGLRSCPGIPEIIGRPILEAER
jgi:hypothetical protein